MLKRVAIFSKDNNQRTRDGVQKLVAELCKRGIAIQLYNRLNEDISKCNGGDIERFTDLRSLSKMPDLFLSVGGDGTFLETVLKVKEYGIPVAGVNTGRMGFLANIPVDEIGNSVDLLCRDETVIVERSLLELVKPAALFGDTIATALNEITIQKAGLSMLTINVFVDDSFLNTYWADGLIVSTATGSTAYNLSVGGPILSPEDESIIISPISPHNLTVRPIVLSGNCKLKMTMEGRSDNAMLTCDFRHSAIPISEEIHIQKSALRLKTVMLKERDFYSTLRNRLMWGADRRN